ncbi:MAG: hypothetical protein AB8G95_26265, partial [Anaerolineae bacterium]
MKQIFALLAITALLMAACGSTEQVAEPADQPVSESVETVEEATDDSAVTGTTAEQVEIALFD